MEFVNAARSVAICTTIALAPSIALAQSTPTLNGDVGQTALTCKSVLNGQGFVAVQGGNASNCCYMMIEEDWYAQNGIQLLNTYLRDDGDRYLTQRCDPIVTDVITDAEPPGELGSDTVGSGFLANQAEAFSADPNSGSQSPMDGVPSTQISGGGNSGIGLGADDGSTPINGTHHGNSSSNNGNALGASNNGNNGNAANSGNNGNNGVGNGLDPQPNENAPINDGPGTGPGNPGNRS